LGVIKIKKLLYWFPASAWVGIIFFLSGRTGNELHRAVPFITDFNRGHILAYFILAVFVYFAFYKTVRSAHISWWTLGICLLYGISDEIHQAFVPTRYPDTGDIIRDMLGALAAVLLMRCFLKRKYKSTKNGSAE
jgi:VanZ family protein